MADKNVYFTDNTGNKLFGTTLGENVFLTDGTDLETKLNNLSLAIDDRPTTTNIRWGTSAETQFGMNSQFLVIVAATGLYTVWFASTNQINVKEWNTNQVASGTDSITLDGLTFSRINQEGATNVFKLKVSSSNSTAFTIIR